MIDNQLIGKVKQYRYLGVMFNASESFSDAKVELYKRGLKHCNTFSNFVVKQA
jgi:hypothetical protein